METWRAHPIPLYTIDHKRGSSCQLGGAQSSNPRGLSKTSSPLKCEDILFTLCFISFSGSFRSFYPPAGSNQNSVHHAPGHRGYWDATKKRTDTLLTWCLYHTVFRATLSIDFGSCEIQCSPLSDPKSTSASPSSSTCFTVPIRPVFNLPPPSLADSNAWLVGIALLAQETNSHLLRVRRAVQSSS